MKFFLLTICLIGSAVADVSHLLNNEYLPPDHQHHHEEEHHEEHAAQTVEAPVSIEGDNFGKEQLFEPSNSLAPEAPQYEATQQQEVQYQYGASEQEQPVEAQPAEEQPAEAQPEATQPEAAAFEYQQQPAAQEFVPQTYGSSIIYENVPEQGPLAEAEQQYESAASSSSSSSSDIDTQYGSNGGYVY